MKNSLLTKLFVLIIFIAALSGTTVLRASTQSSYVPTGSYLYTCVNQSVAGNYTLIATCVQPTGRYAVSVLARYDQCAGQVQNLNGQLFCTRASIQAFGHGSMTISGQPAMGDRPLAIVLVNSPEPNAPRFDASDRTRVFNQLYKGRHQVPDMFESMSNDRFSWKSSGVYGPVNATVGNCGGPDEETKRRGREQLREQGMKALLDIPGNNRFDTDSNGTIDTSELAVFVIYSCPPVSEGGITGSASVRGINVSSNGLRYKGSVASGGPSVNFVTVAHELAHLLGTIDLYGERRDCRCWGVSLMGSTGTKVRSLDPVHRFLLGWIEPEFVNMRTTNHHSFNHSRSEPVYRLLYDPEQGTREFFLTEIRNSGSTYEEGVPDSGHGLLVWRVTLTDNHRIDTVRLIRPDAMGLGLRGVPYGQRAFTRAHSNFSPVWKTETVAPVSLRTEATRSQQNNTTVIRGGGVLDASAAYSSDDSLHFQRDIFMQYDNHAQTVALVGETSVSDFVGIPNNPDAMLSLSKTRIVFFHADQYYEYDMVNDRIVMRGTIGQTGWYGLVVNLDAALRHRDGTSHFFKGNYYYRYNHTLDQVDDVGYMGLGRWTGIPPSPDSAFVNQDRHAIFIKGNRYYRYNMVLNRLMEQGIVGQDGWRGLEEQY